jgi:formylglycine-generating enzyme required for sulfatase activity/predicted secreted protein
MCDRGKSFPFVVLCVLAICSPSVLFADTYEDVSIAVGEEFTVDLASNPSTGYEWVLAGSLPNWLELVDKSYTATTPGLPGGGGTEHWIFRATAPGNTNLTFQYMRPWEGTPIQVHVCRVTVEAPADTEKISVAVGKEFKISLESNPSTGYSWSLAESLPSWLELVDKTYIATDPGMIGGGGTEYWTFRATASGSTNLTFQYMRPWEGTPTKVHVCQVTAETPADTEEVFVAVGEEFKISLESNPSTGYGWYIAESLPSWLVLVGQTWIADDPTVHGGPGTSYFTFRATASGSTTLTFQYMRPWIGVPELTHIVHITAETQEPNTDGFETGDFSVLAWRHQDTPWQVTSTRPFSGTYCARSGAIGDDGISTLTYTRDCQAGQIGFAVRVSSEPKYDKLYFRIDGNETGMWSGEQAWTQVSYPVSNGTHTFAWSYEKDKSKSVGEDAAWIDEVTVPATQELKGPGGIVLVRIPAGTFQMGDHDGSGSFDEQPVHTVTLSAFQMSKYETTNAQYAAYLNAAMAGGLIQVVKGIVYASSDNGQTQPYFDIWSANFYSQIDYSQGKFSVISRDAKSMSDHPVVQVSWYGAKAFCDYYGYRLPTEAEWEYAARGGYHNPYYSYPWGSNIIDCSKANYNSSSNYCNPLGLTSYPYTCPAGHYGPQGAYGLCDMSGNVWEFCQDWYGSDYYSSSPGSNPSGPASGTARVMRGGSWHDGGYRVANRYSHYPDSRNWGGGFRVCR